jgi:rubredoxin
MKEIKRAFHKQRKWVCPKCGRVRFQMIKKAKDE